MSDALLSFIPRLSNDYYEELTVNSSKRDWKGFSLKNHLGSFFRRQGEKLKFQEHWSRLIFEKPTIHVIMSTTLVFLLRNLQCSFVAWFLVFRIMYGKPFGCKSSQINDSVDQNGLIEAKMAIFKKCTEND